MPSWVSLFLHQPSADFAEELGCNPEVRRNVFLGHILFKAGKLLAKGLVALFGCSRVGLNNAVLVSHQSILKQNAKVFFEARYFL